MSPHVNVYLESPEKASRLIVCIFLDSFTIPN
jgi:hypothetical protein